MNPENTSLKEKLPNYGGQAVIEGVMMRGRHSVALAMRAPNNEIVTHIESLGKIYRSKMTKIPFLRGLVILWDALVLGTRMLTLSANTQTGEDEQLEGPVLYITLGISLLVGIALFSLLPAFIGQITEQSLFDQVSGSAWLGNLVEGLVRLGILIAYIWAIGNMPDIHRVFAYHGAEHMTINAFEDGDSRECVKVFPSAPTLWYSVPVNRRLDLGTPFFIPRSAAIIIAPLDSCAATPRSGWIGL